MKTDIVLDFSKLGAGPAELDEEQAFAVDYKGSLTVEAGPGSGKTRMLTEKARRHFNAGDSILCLCFTRAAAAEMASRVPMLPASTIHSYCCGVIGWKEDWGYEGLLYRFLISKDKVKYDYVLIDEVQDLNELEFDVAMSLVNKEVFAVGDPYQSIYGFQGAMGPRVIGRLEERGCRKFELHNNYRSCPEMVEKINKVFDRGLISKGIKDVGLDAILCRRNEDLFYVSGELRSLGIDHRVRLSGEYGKNREYNVGEASRLTLLTIHASKGHEFDRVLLFDWLPNEKGEEERVYYVGMARASKRFMEVGTISELVKGINNGR